MVKTIGIALVVICLLPILSAAQARGPFGGRTTYLAKTARDNSFKPQQNAPKPYMARKAAVTSFSSQKFTTSPYLKKSSVSRGSFAHGTGATSSAGK
jgi:hypothetical protein